MPKSGLGRPGRRLKGLGYEYEEVLKRMKFKRGEKILVEWEDSCGTSGWIGSNEIEDYREPAMCQSCGFLMTADKKHVQLALSRGLRTNMKPFADSITIPYSAIRKIRRVR